MLLIAGVSPRTKRLDQNPRLCPICGFARAYFRRIDHYLTLFFIPLLRVKTGEPFLLCEECEKTVAEIQGDQREDSLRRKRLCKGCGKGLEGGFKFCPHCGIPAD